MRNRFTSYGLTIAGLALLNTTGAVAQTGAAPPPVAQPVPPVVQPIPPADWSKRAVITAVKVPETDVSELLGLHMWQFDIVGTKPAHAISCIVEVQEKGKPPRFLAEEGVDPQMGWPQDGHLSVFVGRCPLYDSQGSYTKSRYVVRINRFRTITQAGQGPSSLSYVDDDPLKETSVLTLDSPTRRHDGSFVLIFASKTIRPLKSPGDVALVFRVQEDSN